MHLNIDNYINLFRVINSLPNGKELFQLYKFDKNLFDSEEDGSFIEFIFKGYQDYLNRYNEIPDEEVLRTILDRNSQYKIWMTSLNSQRESKYTKGLTEMFKPITEKSLPYRVDEMFGFLCKLDELQTSNKLLMMYENTKTVDIFKEQQKINDSRVEFQDKLEAIKSGQSDDEFMFVEDIEDIRNDLNSMRGNRAYTSPISPLRIYRGYASTMMSGPKAMKTLLTINETLEFVKDGQHVIMFDLENGALRYRQRMFQCILGIDRGCIESQKMANHAKLEQQGISMYRSKWMYEEDDLVFIYKHHIEGEIDSDDAVYHTDVKIFKAKTTISWRESNVLESNLYGPDGALKDEVNTNLWQDVTAAYKKYVEFLDVAEEIWKARFLIGRKNGGQFMVKRVEKGTPNTMLRTITKIMKTKHDSIFFFPNLKEYVEFYMLDDFWSSLSYEDRQIAAIIMDDNLTPYDLAAKATTEDLLSFINKLQVKPDEDITDPLKLSLFIYRTLSFQKRFFADEKKRGAVLDWVGLAESDERGQQSHFQKFQSFYKGMFKVRSAIKGLWTFFIEGTTARDTMAREDFKDISPEELTTSGTQRTSYDNAMQVLMFCANEHSIRNVRAMRPSYDREAGNNYYKYIFVDPVVQRVYPISEEQFEEIMFKPESTKDKKEEKMNLIDDVLSNDDDELDTLLDKYSL